MGRKLTGPGWTAEVTSFVANDAGVEIDLAVTRPINDLAGDGWPYRLLPGRVTVVDDRGTAFVPARFNVESNPKRPPNGETDLHPARHSTGRQNQPKSGCWTGPSNRKQQCFTLKDLPLP